MGATSSIEKDPSSSQTAGLSESHFLRSSSSQPSADGNGDLKASASLRGRTRSARSFRKLVRGKSWRAQPVASNTTYTLEGNVGLAMLVDAAIEGHWEECYRLLQNNSTSPQLWKECQRLASRGQWREVECLMVQTAGLDDDALQDWRALVGEAVKEIEAGIESNALALHLAAKAGKVGILKLLLERGADVHAKCGGVSRAECTALHFAARADNAEAIRLLLDFGADVDAKHSWLNTEYTALHFAVKNGNSEVVELLLDKHADIEVKCKVMNQRGVQCDYSPLHLAIKSTPVVDEIVKILVDRGADRMSICKVGNRDMTAMEYAISRRCSSNIIKLLRPQPLLIPESLLTRTFSSAYMSRSSQPASIEPSPKSARGTVSFDDDPLLPHAPLRRSLSAFLPLRQVR